MGIESLPVLQRLEMHIFSKGGVLMFSGKDGYLFVTPFYRVNAPSLHALVTAIEERKE